MLTLRDLFRRDRYSTVRGYRGGSTEPPYSFINYIHTFDITYPLTRIIDTRGFRSYRAMITPMITNGISLRSLNGDAVRLILSR